MEKSIKIPVTHLTAQQSAALKLKNDNYLAMIPAIVLRKHGITENNFDLTLIKKENKLSLVIDLTGQLRTDTRDNEELLPNNP